MRRRVRCRHRREFARVPPRPAWPRRDSRKSARALPSQPPGGADRAALPRSDATTGAGREWQAAPVPGVPYQPRAVERGYEPPRARLPETTATPRRPMLASPPRAHARARCRQCRWRGGARGCARRPAPTMRDRRRRRAFVETRGPRARARSLKPSLHPCATKSPTARSQPLVRASVDHGRRIHPCLLSSSRAIALIVLPSARPLNCGTTRPITAPMLVAPPEIAMRTAARISSASTCAGR